MFWAHQDKYYTLELNKKNLFVARFNNTNVYNWDGDENDKNICLLVKKVNLPSLNIPFERLHGNQFVHYFHVGEVNWEPITITFVDVLPDINIQRDIPNWKKMFFDYLTSNLITEQNRTSMLDLATFCDTIIISSYATYIDQQTRNQKNPKDLKERELKNTDNRKNLAVDFIIKKPKITKIDFGSLDYGSDEANEITVTFLPEWCECNDISLILP
jgi:hypothetical protein